jgi:hypothetical protein
LEVKILEKIERESRGWILDRSREDSCMHELCNVVTSSDALAESNFGIVNSIAVGNDKADWLRILAWIAIVSQSDDVTKLRDILAFKKIASPAFCPVKGRAAMRCDKAVVTCGRGLETVNASGSAVALPTLAKCANKFVGFVRNDLIKEGVEDIEIVFHVGRSALIIDLLPNSC